MSKNLELEACPFCGNTNPFLEGQPGERHVTCNNDLCQASIMPQATDAEAVAAWNRRVPAASRIEAIGEAVAWAEPVDLNRSGHDMFAVGTTQHGPFTVPLYASPTPNDHVAVPVEPKWQRIDHPHRPREADYEVEQLQKRLKQFPDAAVETLTTWALMQPEQGSFAGALWAIAEFIASNRAALPYQGETKP